MFLCKASEVFWKEVLSWLAIHKNELLNVSLADVLFGKFDIDKDFMVVKTMFFFLENILFIGVSLIILNLLWQFLRLN